MSEVIKECAIKLFGKTIGLMPEKVVSDITVSEQRQSSSADSTSQNSKDLSREDFRENKHECESINPSQQASTQTTTTSSSSDVTEKDSKTPKQDEQTETSASQEKTLKKPDKLIPCPRCKSMDTKFCYYNNYNANQPRHFCKKCQRYWTSGGTMRNVPVGSGRRKNKNVIVPNYRHIMFFQEARPDPTNGYLIFGSKHSQNFVPNEFCPSMMYWRSDLSGEENVSKKICVDNRSSVLIPKTLRIDDPNEAAKSSIWSTLGIKNDKIGSTNYKTSVFKAFESKGDRNRSIDNATMVLQANPAALSRSLNFYENA